MYVSTKNILKIVVHAGESSKSFIQSINQSILNYPALSVNNVPLNYNSVTCISGFLHIYVQNFTDHKNYFLLSYKCKHSGDGCSSYSR